MNSAGTIVGTGSPAVICQNGSVTDLNTLVDPNSGWNLQEAWGINDKGQICGIGTHTVDGIDWQSAFLLNPVVTQHPGDANGDGVVDIQDLSVVLANYDKSGMSWAQGDFTGDGTVYISDLSNILASYDVTYGASPGIKVVPEPGTFALLAAGLVGLLAFAWRKQR
jgi:hypothetical protein